MKFLIDNNLSPQLAVLLRNQNLDVIHVKEIGKQSSVDVEIFELAYQEQRIIITADTDFGFLLSQWNFNLPSVILL